MKLEVRQLLANFNKTILRFTKHFQGMRERAVEEAMPNRVTTNDFLRSNFSQNEIHVKSGGQGGGDLGMFTEYHISADSESFEKALPKGVMHGEVFWRHLLWRQVRSRPVDLCRSRSEKQLNRKRQTSPSWGTHTPTHRPRNIEIKKTNNLTEMLINFSKKPKRPYVMKHATTKGCRDSFCYQLHFLFSKMTT